MENTDENINAIERDDKGRWVKGNPPGPGRPKGSISIKDEVRKYLADNPDEVKEIVQHFVKNNRELMWQMLEGRPAQDLTSKGESIQVPIYGGRSLQGHNSNPKDILPDKENTGSIGGDISQ